jgi:hypothetical protein
VIQKILVYGSIFVIGLFVVATAAILLAPVPKRSGQQLAVTLKCGRTFCEETSVYRGDANDPAFASFIENAQRTWRCPLHQ